MIMNFKEKTTKSINDVQEELKDMRTKLNGLRELLLEVSNIGN